MLLPLKAWKSWAAVVSHKKYPPSHISPLKSFAAFLSLCLGAYLLWLPISYILAGLSSLFVHRSRVATTLAPGVDALEHFVGSRECNIKQADIYLAPYPSNPKQSPFCGTRASLLEALSNGARDGVDEPYVGKGCTLRWLSSDETCMVLERFNGVAFIGDDIARVIYLALNMLLREDLLYGGLRGLSLLSDLDQKNCMCDKQFLDECSVLGITSSTSLKSSMGEGSGRDESAYRCERIPHTYIPVNTFPASLAAIKAFKEFTYQKPNPWQPSPVIFSFGHASSFDIEMTTSALEEWLVLARAAERSIPILLLSPPAIGTPESNTAVWQFHQRMSTVAKQKHVDVLGLYNLTLQATSMDGGRHFGGRVALTEAMMIINWLSKLETS